MASDKNEYNEVPYVSVITPNTSPEHVAICSMWAGGPAPPVDTYRAIELGCGDGTNLLSLAFYHPKSTFIGVDRSYVHIDRARKSAATLQLSNVQFECADIMDIHDFEFAEFDYIIAHGVFSWVPPTVRTAILEFCSQKLSDSGLAYISYNTLPGWGMRGLVRDALLRNDSVRNAPVRKRADAAIEVANELLNQMSDREHAYAVLLESELKRVPDCLPSYIVHEYLEPHNQPFWFRDFVQMAQSHGLAYVIDAQFCREEGQYDPAQNNAHATELLTIEQEETIDLLHQRYFRASILCKQNVDANVHRKRMRPNEVLKNVWLAAFFTNSDPFVLNDGAPEYFEGESTMMLNESITKAAILILSRTWPHGKTFDELYEESARFLEKYSQPVKQDAEIILEKELITLFTNGHLAFRLTSHASASAPDATEYFPVATHLAKHEAETTMVYSTPYHTNTSLSPTDRDIILLADGTRTRAEIEALNKEYGQRLQMLQRWGFVV